MADHNRIRLFDRQAQSYEKRRKNLQLASERRRLLRHATGKVLEVSVGAGNNFPFYPSDVHVTAVDFSSKMIEKAAEAAKEYSLSCELVISDVESLDFSENSFDTVVSTLSLCAYENPNQVLSNLQLWLKPGGKILLLEHGISSNPIYAWLQHRLDRLSVKFVGCHQDRDILKMVREAGIIIEQMEQMMLHSVVLIQGTVRK